MRYIPVLTYNSKTEAAFEVHIIDEKKQKEVGIASTFFVKSINETYMMIQLEYYIIPSLQVDEIELQASCLRFLEKMKVLKEIEEMVVY